MEEDWLHWGQQILEYCTRHGEEDVPWAGRKDVAVVGGCGWHKEPDWGTADGPEQYCLLEAPILPSATLNRALGHKCKIRTSLQFRKRRIPRLHCAKVETTGIVARLEAPLAPSFGAAKRSAALFGPRHVEACFAAVTPRIANLEPVLRAPAEADPSAAMELPLLGRRRTDYGLVMVRCTQPVPPTISNGGRYGPVMSTKLNVIPSFKQHQLPGLECLMRRTATVQPVLRASSLLKPKYPRAVDGTLGIDSPQPELPLLDGESDAAPQENVADAPVHTPQDNAADASAHTPHDNVAPSVSHGPIQLIVNRDFFQLTPLVGLLDSVEGTHLVGREFLAGVPAAAPSPRCCALILRDGEEALQWEISAMVRTAIEASTRFQDVVIIVIIFVAEFAARGRRHCPSRRCLELLARIKGAVPIATVEICRSAAECYRMLVQRADTTTPRLDPDLTAHERFLASSPGGNYWRAQLRLNS